MKFVHRVLAAAALLFACSSRADLIYQIDIDTSSLAGNGYMELSLAGLADAPGAIATVTSSSTFGAVVDQFGSVSGDLTGTLQLASELGMADLLQQVNLGSLLSMQVQLGGDWLTALADASITFAIKLWSEDWLPLLTGDGAGDLLRMELLPGGTVSIETFSPLVTVQPVISVPTPAAALLLVCGLLAIGVCQRRSRGR
ncbi:MAG TPA: NF038129 family PEP-CTERM protein [Permianibacter sp.]|nr:NF038129 family PEP-CTERM protein [Permianibacter sp.]